MAEVAIAFVNCVVPCEVSLCSVIGALILCSEDKSSMKSHWESWKSSGFCFDVYFLIEAINYLLHIWVLQDVYAQMDLKDYFGVFLKGMYFIFPKYSLPLNIFEDLLYAWNSKVTYF